MTDASVPAPFNRAEHCRRIGAHGGAVTAARHGSHHYRAIGRAGAQATIRKHGLAFFQGVVQAKGWQDRCPVSWYIWIHGGCVTPVASANQP